MKNINKSEKTYKGNIEITKENSKEWEKKLKYTENITGDLSIYSNVELKAPNLESVGGDLYINSNVELKALKSVGGDLYINSNVELKAPNLESVGGDLYIYSKISEELERQLWENNKKKKWYVCNLCSEWLLSKKGNFVYRLNNVEFPKEWFDKIRKDELSPEEIFAIDNIEHRRIAFEFMDKAKMKQLKDYKVLDEQIDEKGNPMKVLSFTIQNMKEPLKFYNCICPSTGREYFIGTAENTCDEAKAKCWGFKDEEIEFVNEW